MKATPSATPRPYGDGRLHARPALPASPTAPPLPAGLHKLHFPGDRYALLYVPQHAGPTPLSLLVLLHGAAGQHGGADEIALTHAQRRGALLLIPQALSTSWDVIRGGYGPDVAFLDRLLNWTMRRYRVDQHAVSIAGFSDGASYALSMGLMNGDLFGDILAFSPGFMAPLTRVGQPRIFIAHGAHDTVLHVQRGQDIARQLARDGYAVEYTEFDGAHTVSPTVVAEPLLRVLRPAE